MYKLLFDQVTKKSAEMVIRTSDNACIPFDPDNTDYQAYLKWVEEGGQVLPADEVTV